MKSIAYVGFDVHKDFIQGVILPSGGNTPITERRLPNERLAVKKWVHKWEKIYELRCCYEAGGCGYMLKRWLDDMGIFCEVIAPTLIPVKAGERIKTDRRDAQKLARLYRAGELTPVYVPSMEDESVRGLVRCREMFQKEVVQSKHYLLKFLNARGLAFTEGKNNWTQKHWRYLRSLILEGVDEQVYRELLCLLEYKLNRLRELDSKIELIAETDRYREHVNKLRCFKGIGILTAMVILVEVVDFKRFAGPRELMAYLGLVPSERSSGNVQKQGGITKTGNKRVRRILTEAAWHYQYKPAVSDSLKKRHEGQPVDVVAHSIKAQHRLHKKFWSIANRKEKCKAALAVARELAGFIWWVMLPSSSIAQQAA